MDKNFLQGKIHYWMSFQTLFWRINVHFFENVHNCKCSWLKESGTYCNNKSILFGCFFSPSKYTCPNVTVGVRNASPQRLRSLLQPKDFPANHLEPILGSVRFSKIYTDLTWGMKNKKSIKKLLPISCFFFFLSFFSFFVVTLPNTLWCLYFHCCP